MTVHRISSTKTRTYSNNITDGDATYTLTKGETGCDDDPVFSIELILNGTFYIGTEGGNVWQSEGMDRPQRITISARGGQTFGTDMLAHLLRDLAKDLQEYRNLHFEKEFLDIEEDGKRQTLLLSDPEWEGYR